MTASTNSTKAGTVPDLRPDQLRENQRAALARLEAARRELKAAEAAANAATSAIQRNPNGRRLGCFRRR